jgi:serine/threonine protein kinase/Tfp pilus assembly protein PilF
MVGETVAHYKIVEKISEGGMGIVYKAEDTKLKRTVALKFLPPNLTKHQSTRKHFISEAQTASALDHPNICTIHEINETEEGQLYICMAYYEGESLQDKIVGAHGNVPLHFDESIDIAIKIAQGLAVAHEKNIIHRDIKPANILLTERGEVKIVDFGLARLAGEKVTESISTRGTIAYMAPEVIRGSAGDQRSDIWSLGVLLFELLTGHLPFKGKYPEPIMYAIVNEEPEPLSTYRQDVPELLIKILDRLLQKNPAERYQHISDMLSDFEPLLKETGIVGIKTKSAITKRIFRKKTYWISIITIIMIILLLIFSKVYLYPEKKIENSIAILPFQNLSPDPKQDFLLYGIASQLIAELNNIPGLRVSPYRSIMEYKRENKTYSDIGEELRVSYILDTRFQMWGNQIQVIPELIKKGSEFPIWSDNYERKFDDIFDVQDDICQQILERLKENLPGDEIEKTKTQSTENIDAYVSYLHGLYIHRKRFAATLNIEDFKNSEKLYRNAIKLDPNYILSYIELAELYQLYGWYRTASSQERRSWRLKADSLRAVAYEIDPTSPEANMGIGSKYYREGKDVEAYVKYKKALELNPNCIPCNNVIASFLEDRGLFDVAFKYYNRVVELDPQSPVAFANLAGTGSFYHGDFEKSDSEFQTALSLDPNHQFTLHIYSLFLITTKKYNKLREYCLRSSKVYPTDLFPRAIIYALDGNKEEAIRLTNKLSGPATKDYIYLKKVFIYLILGMQEKAFEYLTKQSEMFISQGVTNYLFLVNFPIYDDFRDDPRFQEILAAHKKLYEENLMKYGD